MSLRRPLQPAATAAHAAARGEAMRVEGKAPAAERVLRLGPGVDPSGLVLTPAEGYLLSRVDGHTAWKVLREIGGVAPDEVDRCLERWLADGVVIVDGASVLPAAEARRLASRAKPETAGERAPSARGATEVLEPDPSLELPLEVQKRVLDFARRLDAPYHELLGVSHDADRKALKRAYFALSKEFHPDRYFRRNLGSFKAPLERVFKKIVEAYELLSDPMARAEIERSLAAGPAPVETVPAVPAAPVAAAAPRPRRPRAFTVAGRAIKERRKRAKRLFEAGMAAFANNRWLEAASSVRLAIAFDPWSAIYKEEYAQVQRRAHEERAAQLVKEAETALELRDFAVALRAFEEALHYRPGDAALLHRAARLSLHTGGDLHQAKEWALEAVELEPRAGAYHRLLGQIYKAAGLEANARRELEAALHLDPKDEETRAELRGLSGGLSALRWLGGKR